MIPCFYDEKNFEDTYIGISKKRAAEWILRFNRCLVKFPHGALAGTQAKWIDCYPGLCLAEPGLSKTEWFIII